MNESFRIYPVGIVEKQDESAALHIYPPYENALLGLEGFSHITVCYWFHQNDTPEQRGILQVHPRRDPGNPLTGVFATHSPLRPNLIALAPCRILQIRQLVIDIDEIDAWDGSPIIDIKPYIPIDKLESAEIKIPKWASTPWHS